MDNEQVTSVARALSLMECFLEAESPTLTLNEISIRSGLYKSTCIRLLQTLENFQYVEKLDSSEYRIDYKAMRISSLYQTGVQPYEIIIPALKRLVIETGESASYNVARDDQRICIYRIDSPNRIRDSINAGDIFPIKRGAVGSILQAFSKQDDEKFKHLRDSMIAVSLGSVEPDTAGMSVPVFSSKNSIEGCLAISGPLSRFEIGKLEGFSNSLFSCSISITKKLGGEIGKLESAKLQLSKNNFENRVGIKIMS